MATGVEMLSIALAIAKEEERQKLFQRRLDGYSMIDPVKFFRDKIFETEVGYWKRVSKVDEYYPEKILKDVEDPITDHQNIKYSVNGIETRNIPSKDDLFATSRGRVPIVQFSFQYIKVLPGCTINEIVIYQYVFPDSLIPEKQRNPFPLNDIYHALYSLSLKCSKIDHE